VIYPGKTWASQVFHVGIGTRSAVDVRVTFPDGRTTTRTQVTPQSRISIQPVVGTPPIAVATATPSSAAIGQSIVFDGTGSTDPDGAIASYAWDFGDGGTATVATASHAYAFAGGFTAHLTVTDNTGSVGTTSVTVSIADVTAPTSAIAGAVLTPSVSDDVGVVRVEWYFDGALSATVTTAPFSYVLNLTPVVGSHSIVARSFDLAGNHTDSAAIMLQK
jgi:PKD repeat protein